MRFSKKFMLAIEAVTDVAYNAESRPLRSQEINKHQRIPPRYLEPVLQELVHAGILGGVRGPRGGYRLARERKNISLAEIAQAVENTEIDRGLIDLAAESPLGQEIVLPLCSDLAAKWTKQLQTISIEDLCLSARRAGVEKTAVSDGGVKSEEMQ